MATITAGQRTGQPVELGRYRAATGAERVVIGQRSLGVVRVSDVPATGRGRRYLIERELETKAELDALVTDYLDQASRYRDCPMRHIPVERLTA